MIWAIGLACALGVLVFHFLNLARFRPLVFNQLDLVRQLIKQNRAVNLIQNWLLLALRLATVAGLTFFVAQCTQTEKDAGHTVILLPGGIGSNEGALGLLDSLWTRSGLGSGSHANFYTQDLRLKALFPAITYQPDVKALKEGYIKRGFSLDSLPLPKTPSVDLERLSDSSFRFVGAQNTDIGDIVVNGRLISAQAAKKGLNLSAAPETEVKVGSTKRFYFVRPVVKAKVYIAPSAQLLEKAINPVLFIKESQPSKATVWFGAKGFTEKIANTALFYIPESVSQAQQDLDALGFSGKISENIAAIPDTFDVLDKSFLAYAFLQGSEPQVSGLKGTARYVVDGYSIPVLQNAKGQRLVSVLPNSNGNTILLLHCPLLPAFTNMAQQELFLPLLYALVQRVTQTGRVDYYDVCNKQQASALADLATQVDSILYKKGVATAYLKGRQDRIVWPGIYTLFTKGDSMHIAVNEESCPPSSMPLAYVLTEKQGAQNSGKGYWLQFLLITFVLAEGLLLSGRMRN